MNSFLTAKFPKLALLAGSAIVFGTNAFGAQISRGDFTLPVQTQWGGAVMPPGSYAYELEQAMVGLVISVRGQGKSVRIPAQGGATTGEKSKSGTLLLVSEGGKTSVRSMQFGHLGVTLHFQSPRPEVSSDSHEPETTSRISLPE